MERVLVVMGNALCVRLCLSEYFQSPLTRVPRFVTNSECLFFCFFRMIKKNWRFLVKNVFTAGFHFLFYFGLIRTFPTIIFDFHLYFPKFLFISPFIVVVYQFYFLFQFAFISSPICIRYFFVLLLNLFRHILMYQVG